MFPLSIPPTADEIKAFRGEHNLTQTELANRLQLTKLGISQMETGRKGTNVLMTPALWWLESQIKEEQKTQPASK